MKNPNYKNVSPFKINIFGLLPLIFAVEMRNYRENIIVTLVI